MSNNDYHYDPRFAYPPPNFYLPGPSGMNTSNFHYPQYPVQSVQGSVQVHAQTPQSSQPSNSADDNTATTTVSAKKSSKPTKQYDKWSDSEQKYLVSLWADNFDRLESKDARKVWEEIAREINKKFETSSRTGEKCKAKIKYLIDRYKTAKDWNAKQSGGHRRKSLYYDDIDEVLGCRDVVTMRHVAGSESSSPSSTQSTSTCDDDDNEEVASGPENRKDRKKKSKKAKKEEEEELERKLLEDTCSSLQEQRKDMTEFMKKFNDVQEQQANTMNALVGALTQFLQK